MKGEGAIPARSRLGDGKLRVGGRRGRGCSVGWAVEVREVFQKNVGL